MRALGCAAALALATGCFGAPSPLAPNLGGSVGAPNAGVQTDAQELPVAGTGFVRYRAKGRHYWGRSRLVAAIERAARAVEAQLPGGEPLVVGDLGARHGGKIPGHASHRSGRDVDLLWYVTTPGGAPLRNPGFLPFEGDGLAIVSDSSEYVRLDVPRQWLLIKELLNDPSIGVQFMFISQPLEALITDYARARGEPLELVYRAQTVMLQPRDSLPHDDHLHLRIACAPEEVASGCSGGGPYWEWLPGLPDAAPLDDSTLQAIAGDEPLDPGPAEEPVAAPELVSGGGPGGGA